MSEYIKNIILPSMISLVAVVFSVMAMAADMPIDSSKVLSLQEKDMLVEAISNYKGIVHEYQEDMLKMASDREWLVVKMARIEDWKRQVPVELIRARDRIDAKMIQHSSEISRMKSLTEKHLTDLRALDVRVKAAHGNQAPNWWQFDSWIYGLMYPGKQAVTNEKASVLSSDEYLRQTVQIASPLENDLQTKIKSVELDDWVALVHGPDGLALDVQLPILFGQGKSDVAKDYKPFFKKLAWLLKPYSVRIEVAGYTDSESMNTNPYASSMALGANRAANVVQELIQTGMVPGVFKIISAGDYGDLSPETKELSAAMKRRVEVRVFFKNDNA